MFQIDPTTGFPFHPCAHPGCRSCGGTGAVFSLAVFAGGTTPVKSCPDCIDVDKPEWEELGCGD